MVCGWGMMAEWHSVAYIRSFRGAIRCSSDAQNRDGDAEVCVVKGDVC